MIADGVRELAGFGIAAVSVLRGHEEFEFIAVSRAYDDMRHLIGKFYCAMDVRSPRSRQR